MIVTTTGAVAGKKVQETLGLVRGNSVRARNVLFDLSAFVRNIFGGSVPEYADLLTRARDEATDRMVRDAEGRGADAVIEVRYTTAQVAAGMAEIMAYGTAVRLTDG